MNENPAPGWYPDPQSGDRLGYWDGTQWTANTFAAAPAAVARANNMRAAALVVAILFWFPIGIFCGVAGFRMSGRARAAAASGDQQTATRLLNRVRRLLIISVVVWGVWGIAFTAYYLSPLSA